MKGRSVLKRLLQIVFVLFVLVVAALAAVPFIVTPDFIARQISEAVTAQTGRELRMGGEPSFSFWPELGVSLKDVALTNPPGMAEGQVAQMDELSVRVAVFPLLSGTVEVTEFVVDRPRLDLVIDAQGRSNWSFAKPGETDTTGAGEGQAGGTPSQPSSSGETSGGFGVSSVTLAPIRIVNGSLRYLDERSGTVFAADAVNVTLDLPDLDSAFEAKGSMVWNGETVEVTAYAKSPMTLAGGGASPIELALGSRLINSAFSGQASLSSGFSLAGRIDIDTPSLRGLAKWAGSPLAPGKGLEAFKADGALGLDGQTITLKDANITLDGMRATGTMRTELGGARPKVVASLGVDRIDLDTYLGGSEAGGTDGTGQASGGSPGQEGWSTEPIDFSGLKAVDADLNLVASEIVQGKITTGKTALRVVLDNGVLNARLNELALYGGQAAGTVILNGTHEVPTVQVGFSAKDFNGYELLRDFAGFEWLEGTAATSLSLAAVGRSQRDLVSSLKGTAGFTFTDGAIRGINVAKMIRGVSENILSGWDQTPAEKTDFSLLKANFAIDRGQASNDDLQLMGPLVRVAGAGVIDMPAKTLDYRVNPKLVASLEGQGGETELKGLTVPVVIRGPWSDPKIYPDIAGILQDPQAAYDQIKGLVPGGAALDLGQGADSLKEGLQGTISKETEKLLGPDAGQAVGEQGKKLLDGLFGTTSKDEPAPEPVAPAPDAAGEPAATGTQDEGGPQDIVPGGETESSGSGIDDQSREMLNKTLEGMFGSGGNGGPQ